MQKHFTNVADFLNQHYSLKERRMLISRTKSPIIIYFRMRYKNNPDKTFIYCRLRVNGVATNDFSTGICCKIEEWDRKAKRIKGHSAKVYEQNRRLAQIEHDLLMMYNDLRQKSIKVTAKMLKDFYTSKGLFSQTTLLSCFDEYMKWHEGNIKKETFRGWKVNFSVLKEYLIENRQLNISLEAINAKWALQYHKHLTQVRKLSLSYASRKVMAVSKVLDFAIIQDYITHNPLIALELPQSPPKPILFLNEAEINKLQNCPFYNNRLSKVVDCFLFQCFTGMAYHELVAFNKEEHLQQEPDGQQWIKIRRGKTNTLSLIPVIEQADQLLKKYDYKLPIITNQKMNDFIKEAAKVAGLERAENIGTHVARKTAGTFFLNRGVPIETVSRVLGHSSVRVTQKFYAEILTETIKTNFKNSGLL